MATFSVAGTTASFTALATSFADRGGSLESITVGILVDSASQWGALFSLRSWNVTLRPVPGGNIVRVTVPGGAGVGALVVDGLDSHSAILTDVSRDFLEAGGRSRGSATFLITA